MHSQEPRPALQHRLPSEGTGRSEEEQEAEAKAKAEIQERIRKDEIDAWNENARVDSERKKKTEEEAARLKSEEDKKKAAQAAASATQPSPTYSLPGGLALNHYYNGPESRWIRGH